MTSGFETYLSSNAHLTPEEIALIRSMAVTRTLQRNEFLLEQGQICRHKTFIEYGLLRTFGTSADGSEHIIQFSPENTWTLDAESYDTQQPSAFNIVAVEKSEVLLWKRTDFQHLLKEFPALVNFSQQLISRNGYINRQRLFTAISSTPEEKYANFVKDNPDLLARLSLQMIASYLGISLKTLTRIRHAQLHR